MASMRVGLVEVSEDARCGDVLGPVPYEVESRGGGEAQRTEALVLGVGAPGGSRTRYSESMQRGLSWRDSRWDTNSKIQTHTTLTPVALVGPIHQLNRIHKGEANGRVP